MNWRRRKTKTEKKDSLPKMESFVKKERNKLSDYNSLRKYKLNFHLWYEIC